MAVIPKKATTAILLREKEIEGFEVFLLNRHAMGRVVSWEGILSILVGD